MLHLHVIFGGCCRCRSSVYLPVGLVGFLGRLFNCEQIFLSIHSIWVFFFFFYGPVFMGPL